MFNHLTKLRFFIRPALLQNLSLIEEIGVLHAAKRTALLLAKEHKLNVREILLRQVQSNDFTIHIFS